VSVTATSPGGTTVEFGPSPTGTDGSYALAVDPGTYDFHFTPPAGSGLNPVIDSDVTVSASQMLNLQLTSITHALSGTVSDGRGGTVPNVQLSISSADNSGQGGTTRADANGNYSILAVPGVYNNLQISNGGPLPAGWPLDFFIQDEATSFDLTAGDLTQNFQLTTARLTVVVKDANGNPVPGADVAGTATGTIAVTAGGPASASLTEDDNVSADANGVAAFTVFQGATYKPGGLCVYVGSQAPFCTSQQLAITGDTTIVFQPQPAVSGQSIAFSTTAPSSATYSGSNGQTYDVGAGATSGLPVTLSIDSSSTSGCTISGATVSYGGGTGTCVIDANQPGNGSYLAAPQVTQSFMVSPAPLSITASSPTMTYGSTGPVVTATYSGFVGHDGPGNLTTEPACSTTAASTSPVGTYPSVCSGATDPDYAISYVPGTVTITQATPQVSWPAPAAITYGTPLGSAQLDATASVPGTFSYSPAAGTVLQPGSQTLTVTFTPKDATDYTPATASAVISVGFTQPCLTTTENGSLTVAKGQVICIGPGGTVTGSVTVAAGGALWVSGGTIGGSVSATGAVGITLCAVKVIGSVSVVGASGPVVLGGPGCSGDTLGGSVSIKGSTAGVSYENNHVTGSLAISGNAGGLAVSGNTVTSSAAVTSNTGGVAFTTNTVSGSLTITNNTGGFTYTGNTIHGSVTNSGDS